MDFSPLAHPFCKGERLFELIYTRFSTLARVVLAETARKHSALLSPEQILLCNSATTDRRSRSSLWGPELSLLLDVLREPTKFSAEAISGILNNYSLKNSPAKGEYPVYTRMTGSEILPFFFNVAFKDHDPLKAVISEGSLDVCSELGNFVRIDDSKHLLKPIDITASAESLFDQEGLYNLERSATTSKVTQYWASVVDLLERYPAYRHWTSRVIQTTLVIPEEPGHYFTGSWETLAGVVYLTDSDSVYRTVESLVHEASHQHFYLGEMLCDFTTNDEESYFSPAVNEMRNLRGILLAYHAFGNVAIFYDKTRSEDVNRSCAHFHRNLSLASSLGKMLDGNEDLTSNGRDLFVSLKGIVTGVQTKYH